MKGSLPKKAVHQSTKRGQDRLASAAANGWEDIPLLATYLAQKHTCAGHNPDSQISEQAMERSALAFPLPVNLCSTRERFVVRVRDGKRRNQSTREHPCIPPASTWIR